MKRFCYALLALPILLPAGTTINTLLYSKFIQGPKVAARISGIDLQLARQQQFKPNFFTDLAAGVTVETGSLKSKLSNEYSSIQTAYLERATLNWGPSDYFEAKIGGINQAEHGNPLFLDNIPFFGATEKILFSDAPVKVSLSSYQLAPWNKKVVAKIGNTDNGTSTFMMHKFDLQYNYRRFEMFFSSSYFHFENLNSSVAFNSQFLGNTISGTTDTTARFKYKFEGYNFNLNLSYSDFYLQANMIHNNKAPVGKSDGLSLKQGGVSKNFSYQLEYFRIESDTLPALYNSKLYNTGRAGAGITLKYNLALQDHVSVSFYRTDTLKPEIYHARRTLLFLTYSQNINSLSF